MSEKYEISAINPQDALLAAEAAVKNDLSKLSPEERTQLYGAICRSIGLNPLTAPFEYILFQGKLTLYARRGAADQLRKINGISITRVEKEVVGDVLMVTAYAQDKTGRIDSDIGAVALGNLRGDALANAHMKAITKAKRRVTLSISGLGFLDESETETVPGARKVNVDMETGEIKATLEPVSQSLDDEFSTSAGGRYPSKNHSPGLERGSESSTVRHMTTKDFAQKANVTVSADHQAAMRGLHAAGNEVGIEHDTLRAYAVALSEKYDNREISSMTEAPVELLSELARRISRNLDGLRDEFPEVERGSDGIVDAEIVQGSLDPELNPSDDELFGAARYTQAG